MKYLLRAVAFVLVLVSGISFLGWNSITYAKDSEDYTIDEINRILEASSTTQTIVVSEIEMIEQMIAKGVITEEQLNHEMQKLSAASFAELRNKGYTNSQIESIKDYDASMDALNYIKSGSQEAYVTFRYGLAGSDNTKKAVRIAYDIIWSKVPLFCFTDGFGIGWIATDKDSKELATIVTEVVSTGMVYSVDGSEWIGTREATLDTNTPGIVAGEIALGKADGNYVKRIGGMIMVETQAGSYNLETIRIFVAYAHSYLFIETGIGVAIDFEKVGLNITFSPKKRQEMLIRDNHTFRYSDLDIIEAPNDEL